MNNSYCMLHTNIPREYGWWHLHLDEHLGRDITHDDLYEELAPTTHCKTSKKHSHSPPRSLFLGAILGTLHFHMCSQQVGLHPFPQFPAFKRRITSCHSTEGSFRTINFVGCFHKMVMLCKQSSTASLAIAFVRAVFFVSRCGFPVAYNT